MLTERSSSGQQGTGHKAEINENPVLKQDAQLPQ